MIPYPKRAFLPMAVVVAAAVCHHLPWYDLEVMPRTKHPMLLQSCLEHLHSPYLSRLNLVCEKKCWWEHWQLVGGPSQCRAFRYDQLPRWIGRNSSP